MKDLRRGFFHGIPIGLGYLAVSFSFGIMGIQYGLNIWQTVLISMTNLTSAGQFAGLGIIAAAGSYLEMFVTQLVINIRYALMSIALSQKVDGRFKTPARMLLGYAVTDEIFGVAVSRDEEVSRSYFFGLAIAPYIGWSLGTLLGAVSGDLLPAKICTALSVSLYGMFVAIVVPPMKKQKRVAFVVTVAIVLSCIIEFQGLVDISTGFAVIISAVTASVLGAWLFPSTGDTAVEGAGPDKEVSADER